MLHSRLEEDEIGMFVLSDQITTKARNKNGKDKQKVFDSLCSFFSKSLNITQQSKRLTC